MGISIIVVINSETSVIEIIKNYNRQVFRNKELIIIIKDDSMSIELLKEYTVKEAGIRVYQLPSEVSLGLCLNFAARKASYEYIAKWDEDYYGGLYLQELWNMYINMKCDVIYKKQSYGYLRETQELVLAKVENERETKGKTLSFTKEYISSHWFKDADEGIFERFYRESIKRRARVCSASRYYYINLEGMSERYEEIVRIAEHIEFERACEIADGAEISRIEKSHHAVIFLFELTPYKYIAGKHTALWMKKRMDEFKEYLLESLNEQENQDYEFYISYARESQQTAEQCLIEAEIGSRQIKWGEYIENIEQINQSISSSQYLYIVRVSEKMKIKETFLNDLQEMEVDLEQCRIVDCNAYNVSETVSGGLYTYLYKAEDFIKGERISLKNTEQKLIGRLKK